MIAPWLEIRIAQGGRVLQVFDDGGELSLVTLWCGIEETPIPASVEEAVMRSMGKSSTRDRVAEIARVYAVVLAALDGKTVAQLEPMPS